MIKKPRNRKPNMEYNIELELVKGYEEITIDMLDRTIEFLHLRGIIKVNKQEKIGKPFFEELDKKLEEYNNANIR